MSVKVNPLNINDFHINQAPNSELNVLIEDKGYQLSIIIVIIYFMSFTIIIIYSLIKNVKMYW